MTDCILSPTLRTVTDKHLYIISNKMHHLRMASPYVMCLPLFALLMSTLKVREEKFSNHFIDLHKLRLLTNVDVNLTSSPEVMNNALNVQFIALPGNEVRLT